MWRRGGVERGENAYIVNLYYFLEGTSVLKYLNYKLAPYDNSSIYFNPTCKVLTSKFVETDDDVLLQVKSFLAP